MQLSRMALILSTSCSLLLLSSCGEPKKIVKAMPIPAERIDCTPVGPRPALPAGHRIDWAKVKSVAQAKAEHETYVNRGNLRNQVISEYIVEVENMLFACSNDAQWLREREAELAK
jgi:hypothetical protein